jgi:hypothetical protein
MLAVEARRQPSLDSQYDARRGDGHGRRLGAVEAVVPGERHKRPYFGSCVVGTAERAAELGRVESVVRTEEGEADFWVERGDGFAAREAAKVSELGERDAVDIGYGPCGAVALRVGNWRVGQPERYVWPGRLGWADQVRLAGSRARVDTERRGRVSAARVPLAGWGVLHPSRKRLVRPTSSPGAAPEECSRVRGRCPARFRVIRTRDSNRLATDTASNAIQTPLGSNSENSEHFDVRIFAR